MKDLVAMCVNDLIVQGARPLFFLDYIAVGKINLNKVKKILQGILNGCKKSNCQTYWWRDSRDAWNLMIKINLILGFFCWNNFQKKN